MPTYNFQNKETGEVIEKIISISAREQFLKDNPEYKQVILQAPPLADPTRLESTRRYDSGFTDVLSRIHERSPGSTLDQTSSQLAGKSVQL